MRIPHGLRDDDESVLIVSPENARKTGIGVAILPPR